MTAMAANPGMANPMMGNPMMMTNPMMGNPMMTNPMMGNPMMTNPMMGNPMMTNPMMGNPMMTNPMMGNPMMGMPGAQAPVVKSNLDPNSVATGQLPDPNAAKPIPDIFGGPSTMPSQPPVAGSNPFDFSSPAPAQTSQQPKQPDDPFGSLAPMSGPQGNSSQGNNFLF